MDGMVGQQLVRQVRIELLGGSVEQIGGQYTLLAPDGTILIDQAPVANPTPRVAQYIIPPLVLAAPGSYKEFWALNHSKDDDTDATYYPLNRWLQIGYWQPGILTRWELRHRIARECKDLVLGDAASGTALSLVDPERWEPSHQFRGWELYLFAGTGRGQARRVLDNDQASGTLTWVRTGTPPDDTTRYELHRKHSTAAYNDAINRAIETVREYVYEPVFDESLLVQGGTYEYDLPPHVQILAAVAWRPEPANGRNWCYYEGQKAGDWELAPGRRLRLKCPRPNTRLRLVGQMEWPDLDDDDALIVGPTEYVVWRAAAHLTAQRLTATATDAEGAKELLTYLEARAAHLTIEPRGRVMPNGARVF